MINPNELRIGNYVDTLSEVSRYSKVIAILPDGIKYISFRATIYPPLDKIGPIPITQEILMKCGFDIIKISDNPQSLLGKISISWDKHLNKLWLGTDHWEYDFDREMEINYLHQLQNIYYGLTGEELNVNL